MSLFSLDGSRGGVAVEDMTLDDEEVEPVMKEPLCRLDELQVAVAILLEDGKQVCILYTQDQRCQYWQLWKGASPPGTTLSQVLKEIQGCCRQRPKPWVRVAAYDFVRQAQLMSMLVQRGNVTPGEGQDADESEDLLSIVERE